MWISTPSIIVRFWSGVPPRTASRLPKSPVDATPGSVSRVRKMLSKAPATSNTSSAAMGVAAARSGAAAGADTTCTVSAKVLRNSRISSVAPDPATAGSRETVVSR